MSKLFTILLVVSLYFSPAWAQVTSGTILGTVSDVTDAVLPGAEITVTRVETGASRTDISDDEGRYRFSNLSLGNYEVVASLPGFQTSVRTGRLASTHDSLAGDCIDNPARKVYSCRQIF